jgi:hypothetical protein
MISPRWLCCLLIALAGSPLCAQQARSPTSPHSIPDGTTFLIRLEDKLDASRVQPGKRFKATLAEDMVGPDESRLLRNSRIKGHVSSVGNGLHPHLLLSFDEIETEDGWVPLIATITAVPGEHALQVSGDEGEIERQGSRRATDASASGDEGRRSPTIGAAAGVIGALFVDRRLQLQKGTPIELRLDRPLQVPRR